MNTLKFILISMGAVFFFTACDQPKNTSEALSGSTEILYKHQWNLIELAGEPILPNDPPYLKFEQGEQDRVVGFTGCNQMSGDVELNNLNVVKFSELTMTKMACVGENIEQEFLAIFPKADAWSIAIDELSLFQGKDLLAKFKGLPPTPEPIESESSALNGRWELDSIAGAKLAFNAMYPDQKPSLILNLPAMQAEGSTSCNSYSSAFTIDSNHIEFINLTATEKACNGVGEPTFVNALKRATNYTLLDSTSLTLLRQDTILLKFVRR
jgi:heat shock protein HslJ